jgi:hypothetical protein
MVEVEREILATVFRFVLDCHAKKEGAEQSARNDTKEPKNDGAARTHPTR